MTQTIPTTPIAVQLFELARLAWLRRKGGDLPASPHFRSDALTAQYKQAIQAASLVVEFGAGGSTLYCASLGKPVVAIETDALFLNTVRRQVTDRGWFDDDNQTYLHCDIGATRMWGRPVMFRAPDTARQAQFRACSDMPEALTDPAQAGGAPLVLVDGRFRLATALKAIRALAGCEGWSIWFDDFAGRPQYGAIRQICTPEILGDRIARITPASLGDLSTLDKLIGEYDLDWR